MQGRNLFDEDLEAQHSGVSGRLEIPETILGISGKAYLTTFRNLPKLAFATFLTHAFLFVWNIIFCFAVGNETVTTWVVYAVGLIAATLLQFLSYPALLVASVDLCANRGVQIRQMYSKGRVEFCPLLATEILSGFLILLGTLACIIPGIMLAIWWQLIGIVRVAEGLWGWSALKRSRELQTGRYWRNVVVMILTGLPAVFASICGSMAPHYGGSAGVSLTVTWLVLACFGRPLSALAETMLYYSLTEQQSDVRYAQLSTQEL
eukprot:TRINITY_DN6969_c0_g1_i1.p1 TRINITY_DN6969_c0_g1~~TRINITY_DN6969_c0_g1_i1.p1  ORF type:complete len:263 (+),score=40.26 TRINITY_DN6969_c0_g1_i1:74-862(+)